MELEAFVIQWVHLGWCLLVAGPKAGSVCARAHKPLPPPSPVSIPAQTKGTKEFAFLLVLLITAVNTYHPLLLSTRATNYTLSPHIYLFQVCHTQHLVL